MNSVKRILVFASLFVTASGEPLAQESAEARDINGRLIDSVEEDGTRVHYIYDQQGTLLEVLYSDGRVERYEPVSESASDN